jgi:HAE1 family hydrophobic/amphiphilic exporter-1
MTIAEFSIRRPVFIACLFVLILVIGGLSMVRLGVDLFPDVTFPVVSIITYYPGASPKEVETDVSKVMEDEIGSISGLENLYSNNKDGVSIIVAQFTLETDVKYAQQQIRDKITAIRSKLPDDVKEPITRIADPSDMPVAVLAIEADLPDAKMYELTEYTIKQKLEQADNVGYVEIIGGRKREFHVDLDKNKLKNREISALMVSNQVGLAGKNVPAGTVQGNANVKDATIRSLAEFKDLKDLENTIVNFVGNDVPVTVKDVGKVSEALEDEKSRSFIDGKKSLVVQVYKQTDTNTVDVVKSVKKKIDELNLMLAGAEGSPKMTMVQDNSWPITANVNDVKQTILLGIILTILVVYLALGSGRSTIITSVALPNSLLGAFILMFVAGFTINVITLLSLSLAVGLLIDDAIVVRENIFRHLEMGESPKEAARKGTQEVTLAVIATTLVIISVFAPVSFLTGVVGRFFKSFGLTVCFAMAISLLDALTMGPMLSAYFAGKQEYKEKKNWVLRKFAAWQDQLETFYEKVLRYTLKNPRQIILISLGVFFLSVSTVIWIPKMFKQSPDNGEFMVFLKADPGTSLEESQKYAFEVDGIARKHKEVKMTTISIGGGTEDTNDISIYVRLVDERDRSIKTSAFKEILRRELRPYASLNPILSDTVGNFGSKQSFLLYVRGDNLDELNKISDKLMKKFKDHPSLKDVITSVEVGKPEFDIVFDKRKTERLGVSNNMAGMELRTFVEGQTPTTFKVSDNNYDVRVRLQPDQRDLRKTYATSYVPNINNRLIPLSMVSKPVETTGPTEIDRLDRARYILISADMAPEGPGMSKVIGDMKKFFASEEGKLPRGYDYKFEGQAKIFGELMSSMLLAAGIGLILMYLILASLYESFVIPFTIMLVLPLAICGAFLALFITRQSLDMFSMIGCIMLLGVATKNSIILVDYIHRMMDEGMERSQAIMKAGKTRLRPILMTSFALIAGMAPLSLGLSELSSFRRSMGVAVTGGVISSTILSLIVVPAAFTYMDRLRLWVEQKAKNTFHQH